MTGIRTQRTSPRPATPPADEPGRVLALPGVEERVGAGRAGRPTRLPWWTGGRYGDSGYGRPRSGASLYTIVQPPTLRWHLPSHTVGAGASPALVRFLDHIEVAVAVHGYGRPGRGRDLLLGGRNRTLATQLAEALRRHLPDWTVVDDLAELPREMRGLHPDNPVNRCRGGGVQLELPPAVRGASGRLLDTQVCVPEPGLVAALAEVGGGLAARRSGIDVEAPAHPPVEPVPPFGGTPRRRDSAAGRHSRDGPPRAGSSRPVPGTPCPARSGWPGSRARRAAWPGSPGWTPGGRPPRSVAGPRAVRETSTRRRARAGARRQRSPWRWPSSAPPGPGRRWARADRRASPRPARR